MGLAVFGPRKPPSILTNVQVVLCTLAEKCQAGQPVTAQAKPLSKSLRGCLAAGAAGRYLQALGPLAVGALPWAVAAAALGALAVLGALPLPLPLAARV